MPFHAPQFIGWSTSLAAGVAACLIKEAQRLGGSEGGISMAIDLGSHRVIVPSSFASRLIVEELAKLTCGPGQQEEAQRTGGSEAQGGKRGAIGVSGVLLPVFQTPDKFLNWGDRAEEAQRLGGSEAQITAKGPVAAKETCLLAWVEVLMSPDFSRTDFPALFPVNSSPAFTFEEARKFAGQLMEIRDQLGASRDGHDFGAVAKVVATNPERWQDLHRLEQAYLTVLQRLKLRDHNQVRTGLAKGEGMPEGVTDVWLVGLLDPQPLLLEALERRKDRLRIHIIVGADKADADLFDAWGRPDPLRWADRRTPWVNFVDSVHLAVDPTHAAERMSDILGHTKPEHGAFAVAPCERETYPELIADTLRGLGAEAVNPLGELHSGHALHHRVRAMLDILDTPTFATLRRALMHPPLAKRLTKGRVTFHALNTILDALSQLRPPQELAQTLSYALNLAKPPESDRRARFQWEQVVALREPLQGILEHLSTLATLPARELAASLLSMAMEAPKAGDPLALEFSKEVADAVESALRSLCAHKHGVNLGATEWVRLALSLTGEKRFRQNLATQPVNLPGWMEAPWDPVPHLVVFGLTDDLIPRASHAHPFLPAKLRATLGLTTQEHHFANAAYTLERLRRSREGLDGNREHGRFDVIVPRFDPNGDGLRPSRLLFQCADEDLAARVRHLFEQDLETPPEPYWQIPAGLRFDPAARAEQVTAFRRSISATAFKDYLTNPADFWLKQGLGMRESSHDDLELDRAGFGTLLHAALEQFGRDESLRGETDATKIARRLSECLDTHFENSFSAEPEPGLVFQRETARERLRAFAVLQASLVAEGWRTVEVEGRLPKMVRHGIEVGGRFDRLDYHAASDTWRVYDYKSFDDIREPAKVHTTKLKSNSRQNPDFHYQITKTVAVKKGKKTVEEQRTENYRWNDLQLAVYHRNLSEVDARVIGHRLEVGYIILPSVEAAQAVIWEGFDEIKEFAAAAIDRVCERIAGGQPKDFQPAAKPGPYPVLAAFKGRKVEQYLDPTRLGVVRGTEASR